jgi:hypothetical protein
MYVLRVPFHGYSPLFRGLVIVVVSLVATAFDALYASRGVVSARVCSLLVIVLVSMFIVSFIIVSY